MGGCSPLPVHRHLPVFPDLDSLPQPPELAVLVTPPESVAEWVAALAPAVPGLWSWWARHPGQGVEAGARELHRPCWRQLDRMHCGFSDRGPWVFWPPPRGSTQAVPRCRRCRAVLPLSPNRETCSAPSWIGPQRAPSAFLTSCPWGRWPTSIWAIYWTIWQASRTPKPSCFPSNRSPRCASSCPPPAWQPESSR